MFPFISLCVAASLAAALSIPRNNANLSNGGLEKRQGASDPASFVWVRRFAAIGDSYTAGIGSGEQLGGLFHNFNDWSCSRYDLSYPMMMRQFVGSSIEDFQYPACTGDQTYQIYDQVNKLQGNLDLVTLTAGGNDLCLVDIIKDCIVLAFYDEATCNTILQKAQDNLQNIMRNNIKELLLALNGKMANNGIVVYNSYAQFFNTDNENCATNEDWGLFPWVGYTWLGIRSTPLPLTIARRQRFNALTSGLNDLIREVVHDVADEVNYKIGFSNWDLWPSEGVDGQMCSPSSSGAYPDKRQPDLIFFKPDTRKTFFRSPIFKKRDLGAAQLQVENGTATTMAAAAGDAIPVHSPEDSPLPPLDKADIDPVLKSRISALRDSIPKRDLDSNGVDRAIYRSSLWNSVNPRAAALHALNPRAPSVPGCPSDSHSWLPGLGFFLPDFFGRIFHPNEQGHNAIASFAIAKTMDLRAQVLGTTPEVCEIAEEFQCWRDTSRQQYVTADRADANMKDFCATVEGPGSGYTNWRRTKVYHEGTPDEMEFILDGGQVDTVNRQECLDAFTKIVHGCDTSDNPMNWKFGGRWKSGEYAYDLSPRRNRNWPPLTAPTGQCKGKYKFLFSDFEIYGAGFSSWDWGQETLLPQSKGCLGLGVTKWHWEYFDQPDSNGMEWKVTFRTPVFVSNRCYRNNKVVQSVGGFTNGCGGDSGA